MENNFFKIKIKELRKSKKLTMEALGDILGVSKGTISVWEKGPSIPPAVRLEKICDYFGVSMNDLLGTNLRDDKFSTIDLSDFDEDDVLLIKAIVERFKKNVQP